MNLNLFNRKKTFPRGVHPKGNKEFSAGSKIELLPVPDKVLVPLLQHIGGPSRSSVMSKV